MIDHVTIVVNDYEASVFFYKKILSPLGYSLAIETQGFAGFKSITSNAPIADFWIHQGNIGNATTHIAFNAPNRNAVVNFYQAAVRAGGRDNGKPGIRKAYHDHYYGAFILDINGYNIEAVCHQPVF